MTRDTERSLSRRDFLAFSGAGSAALASGLLLGGVPTVDEETGDSEQSFAKEVLGIASEKLSSLNRKLGV